jgi:hypothetical protein
MMLARYAVSPSFPVPGFAIAVGAVPCLIEA